VTRKALLRLIKLLIFVALVVWVVERIPFRDSAHPVGVSKGGSLSGKIETMGNGKALFISSDGRSYEFSMERTKTPEDPQTPKWKDDATGEEWQLGRGFLSRLTHLKPGFFTLGALAFFCCAGFAGVRWNYLLRANGVRTSHFETWRLYWVGAFFNNFVPGLTGGDLARAYFIAQRTGQKTVPILTVLVDRIVGVTALALLSLLVVLFNLDKFSGLAWGSLAFVLGLGMLATLFLSRSVRRFISNNRWLEKYAKSGFLHQLLEAIEAYQSQKALLLFWLLASVVNHVFSIGFVALIGRAMGLNLPFIDFLVLVPIIAIASAVPITPSGWGVTEALFDLLFAKFAGLAVGEGAGLSAVSRVVGICWSLLGGILLLFMNNEIKPSEIEREMQAEAGI
jgi:glycosyltransferase 2 family protein